MASVIDIPCPNCEKVLKVPEGALGKKVKCKSCEEVFVAEKPGAAKKPAAAPKPSAVSASKPGGAVKPKKEEPKPEPKKEEPKKEEPAGYKVAMDDDDDEGDGGAKPNPLGIIDEGEDIPRCPHCAKELDPPDAVVCIHCGFNNMTRTKADSKTTWAPSTEDYVQHLGPGVLALVGCILLIVLNVICLLNMRDWMTGTFLQKEEKGADGEIAFLVKPGAFITFVLAATIMPILGMGRFAIKRLFIDNKPEEKVKA
jgi:hypothetical protein